MARFLSGVNLSATGIAYIRLQEAEKMYHLIVHWRQPLVFYLSYTITFTLREQKMQLYVSYSHLNKAIFFFNFSKRYKHIHKKNIN